MVAPDVGGAFGLKESPFPEYGLALIAARRLRREVLWVCERSESFTADHHARDMYSTVTLGLDAEGIFLALQVETLANLGAYLSYNGVHAPTNNLGGMSGVYRCRLVHARITWRADQHAADLALSRRRPAGGDLRHRAHRSTWRRCGWASTGWSCAGAT